jgi:hypothetical protein
MMRRFTLTPTSLFDFTTSTLQSFRYKTETGLLPFSVKETISAMCVGPGGRRLKTNTYWVGGEEQGSEKQRAASPCCWRVSLAQSKLFQIH